MLACADRATSHWHIADVGNLNESLGTRLRGFGNELKGDFVAAIGAYRETLDLLRPFFPESTEVAICLNDIARVEQAAGDLDAAEIDYREALRIARAIGYSEGVADYIGNLATIALNRADWRGAEALAREALDLSENVGRQELIASDCHNLSKALVLQARQDEALPYVRRAVEIFAKLSHPDLASAQATLDECEAKLADLTKD